MDVVFNVPGNTDVRAGVTGFGAVFTDVDSATSTRLQFFAPDGALLFERAVPAAAGNETLSFLGVSFDRGEIVGRVRIVSGNAALGPAEAGNRRSGCDGRLHLRRAGVHRRPDDFAGSGTLFEAAGFELVIGLDSAVTAPIDARVTFDGYDATGSLAACFNPGALRRGGTTLSCPIPRGQLTEGDHVLQVVVTDAERTVRRNAVRYTVIGASR